MSVDPLTRDYAMLTPYQFASNRPIDGIDLDGLEFLDANEALFEFLGGHAYIKLENVGKPTKHYFTTFNKLKYGRNESGPYMEMERPLLISDDYNYKTLNSPQFARDGLAGPRSTEVDSRYPYEENIKAGDNSNAKTRRKSIRSGNYTTTYTRDLPSLPSSKVPAIIYLMGKVLHFSTQAYIQTEIDLVKRQASSFGEFAMKAVKNASDNFNDPILQNIDARGEIANYIVSGVIARPDNFSEDEINQITEIAKVLLKLNNITIRDNNTSNTELIKP